ALAVGPGLSLELLLLRTGGWLSGACRGDGCRRVTTWQQPLPQHGVAAHSHARRADLPAAAPRGSRARRRTTP
ncbi:MAG: hypothetical protein ACKPBU_04635, partial [Alphaproteobacteria bacterium]